MAPSTQNQWSGARLAWAVATPFLLAAGVIFLPLLPALCLFLDWKSRTYTGAATLLIAAAAVSLLAGPVAASVAVFLAVTTAGAYALSKTKLPFSTCLVGSAAGGVLGVMALLGILGASMGKPVNQIAADWFCGVLSSSAAAGNDYPLNFLAWMFQKMGQDDRQAAASSLLEPLPREITNLPVADRVGIVQPAMEMVFSIGIPGQALVTGMLTGALGYYLPKLALGHRRETAAQEDAGQALPPFASFKLPKYIVITLLLLQLAAMLGASGSNVGFTTMEYAATMLFNTLMGVQALALGSFLLNRKRVHGALQLLILAPVALVLSALGMLSLVGFFDAIFDLRTVIARVDQLKSKGKQVFTQGGLDELRRMEQNRKNNKNGKNDRDGEDDRK